MQLTYLTKPAAPGFAGSLADNGDRDVISRVNNEGASVPFGIAMAASGDGTVDLPDSSADIIMGIAIHDHAHENRDLATTLAIQDGEPMGLLTRGRIWVIAEDAVDDGDEVWVRHAASGGNTQLGRLMGVDDGANASKLGGCRWRSTAGAGELALLEVNLQGGGAMS